MKNVLAMQFSNALVLLTICQGRFIKEKWYRNKQSTLHLSKKECST